MSLRRTLTLIRNEVRHGPRGAVLVMAVATPLLLGLFVNLAFGNIFTQKAKLGVYDQGQSQITAVLKASASIICRTYASESSLRSAASSGAIDMGLVLPEDFDTALKTGSVKLKAYVWGESMARSRAVIAAVLTDAAHEAAGSGVPVDIETVTLGEPGLPWNDRLLPLVVLTAVFFGGLMIPAASLINEKQKHTLEALNVTPATLGDVFAAKGIIGAVLALIMGVLSLVVSGGGLGATAWAQFLILALAAVMAAEIGLVSGALVKDMNTLFALWKFGGLLLFGPAIVYMFPQVPEWIGYVFPTFYVIKPMVDMSVSGHGFAGELLYMAVLVGLVGVGGAIVAALVRRLSTRSLRLNA